MLNLFASLHWYDWIVVGCALSAAIIIFKLIQLAPETPEKRRLRSAITIVGLIFIVTAIAERMLR